MATFTQIKLRGHQCTLIFTGSHYYLHSSFFGLLGRATRHYDRERETNYKKALFTLEIGNSRCDGGTLSGAIEAGFKRAINKMENTYVEKTVEYNVHTVDCDKFTLKIEVTDIPGVY